ncbi:OLC1v1023974C1 [Oldenlandia corymbosa var. corymbosa]|uniref:OLC1v1023974C1 n=1 Tax=Oldenlandia corymbosa var. corymbosa TaxID=529605 RepID=A0AAV1C201_OLDCO|nr:OLC1v1023974C1 [Oldenlandia corymbosa var. corymbosa]
MKKSGFVAASMAAVSATAYSASSKSNTHHEVSVNFVDLLFVLVIASWVYSLNCYGLMNLVKFRALFRFLPVFFGSVLSFYKLNLNFSWFLICSGNGCFHQEKREFFVSAIVLFFFFFL